MKKLIINCLVFMLCLCSLSLKAQTKPKIYIAFQWHMHQPIYMPYESVVTTANSGVYSYSLYDVFNTRTGPYTTWPKDAVQKGIDANLAHLGAQVSFSGSLIENLNNLEAAGKGFNGWKTSWNNMKNQKTSLGNPRIDMVGFGYHHPLMGLIDYDDIRKQIQKHKEIFAANFTGAYSKGIFPPENAFSERMIPALVDEGMEWVIVDNINFDRAAYGCPTSNGSNVIRPNKADIQNPNPNDWKQLSDLWSPIQISIKWAHQPHYVQYINPLTGTAKKIIAIPASRYLGNEDGRGGFGALQYEKVLAQMESYNTDASHPILIVLHHDGDNYGGGTDSYYGSNFQNFVNWLQANSSRFECTTIQDYLQMFPVSTSDVIHVQDGAWSGADNGDPEFKKWNADPGANNYSFDRNSWGVVTAAKNIVLTANQINANSTSTKNAWNYFLNSETSCYWYWDGTEMWDSHPSRACNMAVGQALPVVQGGTDLTAPTIYIPQREPYNPGDIEWDPTIMSNDFKIWTYVFDYSGLASVKLKWRTDKDGSNPITSMQNEVFAQGTEVNAWQEIAMTGTDIPSITNPLPTYKAKEYAATIAGQKSVLIDYYVESVDTKGNIAKSDIQHVWVGAGNTPLAVSGVSVSPTSATILPGGTQQLIETIIPSNATNKAVIWSSSNNAVATVSSSGLVTGVAIGDATITVTTVDGGFKATSAIKVSNTITGFKVYFYTPTTWAIPAKVYWWGALPAGSLANATWPGIDMDTIDNNTSRWYKRTFSNVTSTSLIFNSGSNQTGNLSRSSNGWYMGSTWYDTDPSIVTAVTVSPTTATFATAGLTQQLTPTIAPTYAMIKRVRYSSSNNAVATVSSTGLITAVGPGNATITVTTVQSGKTATCAVTVSGIHIPVTGVTIVPPSVTVEKGATYQLYATVSPVGATNKNVIWTSNNTNAATVSSTGLVTAINPGKADITVTTVDGGFKDVCVVTVPTVAVTGVLVTPPSATISVGGTQQLIANVTPLSATNKNVIWTTSSSAVATVSQTGLVTGVALGIATITATTEDGGFSSSSSIIVSSPGTFYMIKNRWKTTTYLKDNGAGKVTYGTSPATADYTYQWAKETVSGYTMLKNRSTGLYMHNENLYDYVQSGTVLPTWWSAMWTLESTGDGWIRIRNRYKATDLVHLENLKGYAQRIGASNTWWSAMWQLETVTTTLKAINIAENSISKVRNVTLFPNPVAKKVLNVTLTGFGDNEKVTLTFTDFSGKTIIQKHINESGTINLDIPSGVYIVKVNSKDFNKAIRLIVE